MSIFEQEFRFLRPTLNERTDYYLEGSFLGTGNAGIDALKRNLLIRKPRSVAFARSRYTNAGSHSPNSLPFGARKEEVLEFFRTGAMVLIDLIHEEGAFIDD